MSVLKYTLQNKVANGNPEKVVNKLKGQLNYLMSTSRQNLEQKIFPNMYIFFHTGEFSSFE